MREAEEGESFATLDLARRLERAEAGSNARFVEARARIYPESGAGWIEVAGAYALFDGPESPCTQTFGLGMFAEARAEDLARIEAFFGERGAPVFHEVSPLAGVELHAQLAARGYRPVEFTSVLYRALEGMEAEPAESSIRVSVVVGGAGQQIWGEVSARGWAEFAQYNDFLQTVHKVIAERHGAQLFLAEVDGQPAAAGALSIDEGVALLAGAATVPELRRRGAQRALLAARLRHAAASGCNLAMICASPGSASQRNAERNGFRIAYTRVKWGLTK